QAVPEPQSWVIMLMGFGVIGGALRYRPAKAPRSAAG
ncbi:PEPxxWA-CTERM sorting domain-containing protein, partial [Sphingomonas sp. PsM26]|nr:PEPxxWA-CTERM sorting domain-containing protein [Sphingomonas sp. PsM26]